MEEENKRKEDNGYGNISSPAGARDGSDASALRNHKDTVFRKLFSIKENAIELYNALEGTDFGPDTEIEFTTLDNAIYVDKKNDLGFIIAHRHVVITEHQSSISYNIPLRDVSYIAKTFENITKNRNKYGRAGIKIPVPEFYVIYTGSEEWREETIKLSDYYMDIPPLNSLELVVKIIKIGYTNDNKNILEKSPILMGYAKLLEYINNYRLEDYQLTESIDLAIKDCINQGYIVDFLVKEGREVSSMLYDEITSEEFAEIRANEAAEEAFKSGRESGLAEGEAKGRESGLAEGEARGRQYGLAEGEAKAKQQTALTMLNKGLDILLISEVTGIPIAELKALNAKK